MREVCARVCMRVCVLVAQYKELKKVYRYRGAEEQQFKKDKQENERS